MTAPTIVDPERIEAESFRIIEEELGPHAFTPEQFQIVRRVIHASADFEFARQLRFHPRAVASGIRALRRGADVVADVEMVQAGVSQVGLARFGGTVRCFISDEDVIREAKAAGVTRAIMSMRKATRLVKGGVYAIGNAPTALFELIRLIEIGEAAPDLVIGVPVGFVSAAESKQALSAMDTPFITALGRKGGTPTAVATVNALLRLA